MLIAKLLRNISDNLTVKTIPEILNLVIHCREEKSSKFKFYWNELVLMSYKSSFSFFHFLKLKVFIRKNFIGRFRKYKNVHSVPVKEQIFWLILTIPLKKQVIYHFLSVSLGSVKKHKQSVNSCQPENVNLMPQLLFIRIAPVYNVKIFKKKSSMSNKLAIRYIEVFEIF